ncbi:sulfatase-like hydrolase/transferase [bacterium]|nr:sulfatase-like hydrolase/transferase [bacterium]MCI0602083.1 sulfatase-like hydrolase/transferase [bacterium]
MNGRNTVLILLAIIAAVFLFLMNLSPSSRDLEFLPQKSPRSPRFVLLYATCSLNKDLLAPYNGSVRYTPNLKSFAKGSTVFLKHESESGFSGAGYAGLFSGTYMYRHGVYYHPQTLADSNYLIAEAFQKNSYETFFWNAHTLASAELNFAQGVLSRNVIHHDPRIGALTATDQRFMTILRRLRSRKTYNAFLQVNFSMTHAPYSENSSIAVTTSFCAEFPEECSGVSREDLIRYVPIYAKNHMDLQLQFAATIKSLGLAPAEVKKLIDVVRVTYESSVRILDRRFGETIDLIRKEKLLDESLIIFTADHGEILYRSDSPFQWTHGGLEPEALEIPLMIRAPAGTVLLDYYPNVTRAVDVFPTVAGLSEIKIQTSEKLDGQDLSDAMQGKANPPQLIALACTGLSHPAQGVHNDPYRMGVQAREEDVFYRLLTMPNGLSHMFPFRMGEFQLVTERFNPDNQNHRKMKSQLHEYKDKLTRAYKAPTDESNWDQIREQLRNLGYLN